MISSFFVLSPRGDTILSKMYRTNPSIGAHERAHTEAFFRKVKFWNDMNNNTTTSSGSSDHHIMDVSNQYLSGGGVEMDGQNGAVNLRGCIVDDGVKRDPPPVFVMPDGQSYLHVNRNGLIFACATARNVSPCTVIEVS